MQRFEYREWLKAAELFHERIGRDFLKFPHQAECSVSGAFPSVDPRDFGAMEYRPIHPGEKWGNVWEHAVFKVSFPVPEEWQGKEIALRINPGGETLVFDEKGNALAGLTNASIFAEYDKTIYRIPRQKHYPERMTFYLDAAAYEFYGGALEKYWESGHQEPLFEAKLLFADVGVFREELWQLACDLEILISLVKSLKETFPAQKIVRALSQAMILYQENPENSAKAHEALLPLFEQWHGAWPIRAAACGHGHVDVGWLWPVAEGIHKAARTFSSQIDLLERYPDYVFGASQPFLYDAVKRRYPGLYAKIKAMVKCGRWELQGGMWVEADSNIASPESLIRQCLHGKNFFYDEFGIDVKSMWLPDIFGYSPVLPQIILKSGCDHLLAQKIYWNQVNSFPYHTFFWEGIDGSSVVTHFPPENSYASNLLPEEVRAGAERFSEQDFLPEFLVLYGIGDGGGGPCDSHVEHGRRLKDLIGVPQLSFCRSDAFFERLRPYADQLPAYRGELYLENHRGTLTSQAGIKRENRAMEYLLSSTELLSTLLPAAEYPAEELAGLWKELLTRQFHDILPGSSIAAVYRQCAGEFQAGKKRCEALQKHVAGALLRPDETKAVFFNPLSFPYSFPVALPDGWEGADCAGNVLPVSSFAGKLWVSPLIPPFSSVELTRRGESRAKARKESGQLTLENEFLRVKFDDNGEMLSCLDRRTGKEMLAGKGNALVLYNDHPNEYDAWNIDRNYRAMVLDRAKGSGEVTGSGTLLFSLHIGHSEILQEIRLLPCSAIVEFDTKVKWQEAHRMLRCGFETAIRAPEARFDLQYGWIKRSTGENNLQDMARFETLMHRYVSLADDLSGVTLLNDGKYGSCVRNGMMDMALLRAPKYPDSNAGAGEHHFRYGLLVHSTGRSVEEVNCAAANFNRPPLCFAGFSGEVQLPFSFSGKGTEVTVVKRAERDLSRLVLRVVETSGQHGEATFRFASPVSWCEADLMEWHELSQMQTGAEIRLPLTPFEIKTLFISFSKQS